MTVDQQRGSGNTIWKAIGICKLVSGTVRGVTHFQDETIVSYLLQVLELFQQNHQHGLEP